MWEWSHTQEAYDYAREQLDKLPRSELLEIVESWNEKLANFDGRGKPTNENGERLVPLKDPDQDIHDYKLYSDENLASWIWECASNWQIGRNCSNGGHELYLDPEGWHTVDLEEMPDDWQPSDY